MGRAVVEQKIIVFCKAGFKSLSEIAEKLGMNKNTLRAGYLYPMTKEGKLKRSTKFPFRSGSKYKST